MGQHPRSLGNNECPKMKSSVPTASLKFALSIIQNSPSYADNSESFWGDFVQNGAKKRTPCVKLFKTNVFQLFGQLKNPIYFSQKMSPFSNYSHHFDITNSTSIEHGEALLRLLHNASRRWGQEESRPLTERLPMSW